MHVQKSNSMKSILTINAGSSSVKFALYLLESCTLLYTASVNNLLDAPLFKIYDAQRKLVHENKLNSQGHSNAIKIFVEWLTDNLKNIEIVLIGHRVVHGGTSYKEPVIVSDEIILELEKLIILAPLHQPYNIEALKIARALFPEAVNVACFDTGFHSSCDIKVRRYAIPDKYSEDGVIRYGFHGLSYEYIASILPNFVSKKADGKVVVAHLGNGSSMCAMLGRKSVNTTMGFTALEGLMMGTRAGSIDPGIILHLQQHYKLSLKEVENLLYKQSGLLGVSGISHDVEILQKSENPKAKQALEMFCYRAAQQLAMLTMSLQGLEVLVFTAGIGENSVLIRQRICELSAWLGIEIDIKANQQKATCISLPSSKIEVYVIPTNEELMIAQHSIKVVY